MTIPYIYSTFVYSPVPAESNSDSSKESSAAAVLKSREPIHIASELFYNAQSVQAPLRIVIPNVNIDLSIVESKITNGMWEISETTASHGLGSAYPGQLGNTVIFAHAREKLFGPLRTTQKDDFIYVLTKDRWFRYKIVEIKLVLPAAVEVIKPTNDETLTLFTCSGFMDSKRLIVIAKPYYP